MNIIEVVSIVIGSVATILTGMWFMINKAIGFGKLRTEISSHGDKLHSLPCREHHDDLLKIKTILITKFPYLEKSLSMKASPRKLNPIGEKLFKEINGQSFLDEYKERLFQIIDNAQPLVPYDVQQEAMTAFAEFVNTPAFNCFKNFVYNAPEVKLEDGTMHAYDIPDVCFVLGLKLRDMYLAEHPEINTNNK